MKYLQSGISMQVGLLRPDCSVVSLARSFGQAFLYVYLIRGFFQRLSFVHYIDHGTLLVGSIIRHGRCGDYDV